jgi:hypothetical protein
MSHPTPLVKRLAALRLRLSQAEGKFKFAVRRQQRKMAHSALGAIFDNKALLLKLAAEASTSKMNQASAVEPLVLSLDLRIVRYHSYPAKIYKDVSNMDFEYFSILDFLAQGGWEFEEKFLEKYGYFTTYNTTLEQRTITALCCDNPNYHEPTPDTTKTQILAVATKENAATLKFHVHCGQLQAQSETEVLVPQKPEFHVHCGQLVKNKSTPAEKAQTLANDGWLQAIMNIPVPVTTKGLYYKLYFDANKLCVGGLARKEDSWVYSGTDYAISELVWLPNDYNPTGKHLDELKKIPKPPLPAVQTIEEVDFTSKKPRPGRPKKETVTSDCASEKIPKKVKSTIPKTHTVWTGTVISVRVVDGKDFGSPTNPKLFKRLCVEIKTTCGEIVQFWTPNVEIRDSVIDSTAWIKFMQIPKNHSSSWSNIPIPTFKNGDLITVSGKIKTTWHGVTVINWVRLQEVIPQKIIPPILKTKADITPYKGEQLSFI